MKTRPHFGALAGVILVAGFFISVRAWADLNINVIAVNASDKDFKEQDVKFYLPKELEPSDVLDMGDLKIDYDVDQGEYFVYGKYTFNPKETKTFKIKVKDVWVIQSQEIDVLKNQLNESVDLIQKDKVKKEFYPQALVARDKLNAQIDFIVAQQNNYSENIDRRIEQYRAYRKQLLGIRQKIFDQNYLTMEAPAEIENETTKTVKFIIQVKNPSATQERAIVQKHYLPDEVRSEHVVDSKDFEVRFDDAKGRAYLTKEETFKPGEEKIYEVMIKDIWSFPYKKVEPISQRTETAWEELQNSVYADSAQFLIERIKNKLEQIMDSQAKDLTVRQAIGLFRVNEKRFQDAKDDLDKLEKMITILKLKKLAELESGKVKNILQRLQALRGLAQLSEAIFKKGLSVTATWRIIFGLLLFVGFFTALHFFIWARRSKTLGEGQGIRAGEDIKVVPKPGEAKA